MSWIQLYGKEDYTFYSRWLSEYEILQKIVARMEWRLEDFRKNELIKAFENTLAARSREITGSLDLIPRRENLPAALAQLLKVQDDRVRTYLSEVVSNANSQLLDLRLGKAVPVASQQGKNNLWGSIATLRLQNQHMSEDDPSFQIASILIGVFEIAQDLDRGRAKKDYFKLESNVSDFRDRVNQLVSRCELGDEYLTAWAESWASRVVFAPKRRERADKLTLIMVWKDVFRCLRSICNNTYGFVQFSQATANGDWGNEKQLDWLNMINNKFGIEEKRLENLLARKANAIKEMLTLPSREFLRFPRSGGW